MQQARELLAAEYAKAEMDGVASAVRLGSHDTDPEFLAVAAALCAAPECPEGFVLVPVEPTQKMLDAAGIGANGLKRRMWELMLAARPQGVKDAR